MVLNNGLSIPAIGFGTWPYNGNELQSIMEKACQLGYSLVDTAWLYQNETIIGNSIQKNINERDEVFITSKLHINNLYLHRYHYHFPNLRIRSVKQAYLASCNRLGVDYIDLYLIHWPFPNYLQMWESMTKLYKQGKVKAIGVSSFMPKHLESLKQVSDIVPAVNQIEMNPFNSRRDVVSYCLENGIIPEAYSPLGRGKLTMELMSNQLLQTIAHNHNKSVAQIILRWLHQHGVIVIPRTNKEDKLRQNISIFDFELSSQEMDKINSLNRDDFIRGDSRNIPINGK